MKIHSLYLFFPLYSRIDVSVLLLATARMPPPACSFAARPAALMGARPIGVPLEVCPVPSGVPLVP